MQTAIGNNRDKMQNKKHHTQSQKNVNATNNRTSQRNNYESFSEKQKV